MVLNFLGDNCFRVQSGEVSLLTNPVNNRLKADVVLRTIVSTAVVPPTDEIVFPGEYEAKGIEVQGWEACDESTEKFVKTIYVVRWEEMRFVFMGHLSKPITGDLLEEMSEADVLFLPLGEHYLDASDAARLVKQLEPKIVVPSYTKKPGEFVKLMGEQVEPQEKFVFRQKDIADAKGRIILLEPKG